MILDLGKSFVPLRHIMGFMRKRGYYNISVKHIHNPFEEHTCNSAHDSHTLLKALDKSHEVQGW